MTAPATDPIIVQIMDKIAAALAATISTTNGFYTNVAGAGIEPLAFDDGDNYPQIVVQEESSSYTDSNARTYQESVVLGVHGFVKTDAVNSYRDAMRLRDDITRVLQSVTKITLSDSSGAALARNFSLTGNREVVASDLASGFLDVIVRVALDYRDSPPPVPGI